MKPEWSCLKDVKIIDASQLLPGPHATSLLLQLGADVIKVERRGSGDPSRELGSAVFAQFNRDKRSVALDLRDNADREAFLELVRGCDAVVEGFRPGVMNSFGLGYDDLVKVNPAIVMCSISGFGQTGPYADNAGHDLNYLAMAGYWAAPVQVESKVARPGVRVSDYAASSYAALSLVVAIMSARQNGYGQHLDVSIHDSILSWTAPTAWLARSFEKKPVMSPLVMPENDIFETQDGRHLALGILENKFWVNLCDCLGEVFPLLKDPRFSTRMGRLACKLEVNQLLKQVFLSKPLAQWVQYFADVDLPFSPLLGANELFADAHVQSRGTLREFAKEGTIAVRFPVKFSLGLPDSEGKVPALGEFTPGATE
ncbi:CoA transferase [Pseudomonas sp. CCM 7893]|uniref:CoA transferase n=1 Tax=Pseudomonas spelaei TaxID=1055469 RepID=A0A6I3VZC3_9PSED|nr:CaiB/BaiF CoA-transferase family protein [Pseudomonas spelaei]MUF03770.1 CoA transferase [Pseudomonas spelaei]